MDIAATQSIKGYELLELLGEGAHGAVYRAQQQFVNREVAVKIILPEFANRPEFIRRFEKEARLVARLEHMHILPLYDFWRDPAGAYLVMRLMRGGNLSEAIQSNGNLAIERTAELIDQIASAVNAAHHKGVVHRDLKPANILLDEEGNAYLSDFGIAKELSSDQDITQTSTLLGTPAYMAPEQFQGKRVSAQTDIYALGILIYELLVGEHPFGDTSTGELVVKHMNDPIPYVRERRPELPAALDGVIQKATAKKPDERYPSTLLLVEDFHRALDLGAGTVQEQLDDLYNPYKGLRAFQEYDHDDFFGRDHLVGQLLAKIVSQEEKSGFLAVVGPSGSGKSSVVKAGLLPALRKGALPGSDHWYIIEMHPGRQPLVNLELALLGIAADHNTQFAEIIRNKEGGLGEAINLAIPEEDSQLVLVIDQFEELYSLVEDEEQRRFFLDGLCKIISLAGVYVRVVITLRADFYDRPLLHPEFGRFVEEQTVLVLPLSTEELEAVIRKPAEQAGAVLEKGLVPAIIADVSDQPGALPLLQYALTELFDHREGRMLSCEAYQSIGGVLGALGRRAEEVYTTLDHEEKQAARQMFLRLVTLGEGSEDTRRRVVRSELTGIHPDAMPGVIELFGNARLLTFDRDPDTREPTLEVAHEALLLEWKRLGSWLDGSRADIRMQRVLANAAGEWQTIDHNPGYLLRDTRLDQFEAWAVTTDLALTEFELEYLEASLAERKFRMLEEEKRQAREAAMERRSHNFLRVLVAVLTIATIVAVGLTIFAFNQRREAQSSAATAQAEAFARTTQQMVAELEADQRATQQAVAEEETRARSTAEAIAVEERDKVLRQASVALADRATKMKDLGDPELAVLLTLAALENYPYTPEAEQALAESVLEVPTSKLVPGDRNSSWLAVDWSPTTDLVATALFGEYREPTILIQDPQNGSEVITIPMGVDCYGASNIAWSPLGDRLITVPRYCDYAPRIFDATSGELITTLASQPEQANFAAAWAPDGKFILTGSLDGFARIWDVKTGEMVLAIPAHENYITEVAWSPTGDAFATGSNDDTVKAWKAESGELQFVFNHTDDVAGLDWSPGGENIVIAGLDGTAKVLDGQTGELFMSLAGHMDQVWDAAWSPNGAIIATDSRDGLTRFWDASTAKELFRYPNYLEEQLVLNSIDWSPDGKRVLIMGVEFNQVWDLTSKSQARQSHSRGLTDAKWSPDGQFLATGSLDNTVRIWDSVDNALVVIFDHPESILNLSWSPDSLQLAATGRDGSIRVWDVDSQSFQKMPDQERIKFTDLAWSPNGGRIIATSEFDQVGMIWDVDSGETISLEQGELRCFLASPSWSPEGDRIVTGCVGEMKDTPARLWDAEKGTELERFHSVGGVSQVVSWSQNGKFIAVGYSEPVAQIWDAVTLQPVLRFGNHSDKIVDLNFAPNSQRVVSIDAGRYMLVWDVETGSVVHSMRSSNTPTSVDWHPFGTHVIATTIDTEPDIKPVWQSTQDLISYAELCCARGELNEDQRKAFGLPLD